MGLLFSRLWPARSSESPNLAVGGSANLVTFQQLIDSALPNLEDKTSLTPSSSRACHRLAPRSVREWENFSDNVTRHRQSLPAQLLATPSLPKMPVFHGRGGVYTTYNELEICFTFLQTAGEALNALFNESVSTVIYSRARTDIGDGLRVPDFISERIYTETDRRANLPGSQLDTDSDLEAVPMTVGEMKRHNFSVHGDDMVKLYDDDAHVRDAFYQLVGYQVRHNCKYGFMSTYEFTWATRLSASGILSISPAFRSDVSGDLSTLNMIYYVLCLAFDELADRSKPWKLPKNLRVLEHGTVSLVQSQPTGSAQTLGKRRNQESDDAGRQGKRKGRAKSACSLHVTLIQVMVSHEDRVTWQARGANKCLLAVKGYSDAFERDREVECYQALQQLQGVSIPHLLESAVDLPDANHRRHALVTSWVDGRNYMTLPAGPLEQARQILSQMHALGVAHGDPRPENMRHDFRTGRLYVYDFSHALTRGRAGAAAFSRACAADLAAVDALLEESRTAAARRVLYMV